MDTLRKLILTTLLESKEVMNTANAVKHEPHLTSREKKLVELVECMANTNIVVARKYLEVH